MKDKTLKRRRAKSAEYFEDHGTSKYAQKAKQHRRGIYNERSPFRTTEQKQSMDREEKNHEKTRN